MAPSTADEIAVLDALTGWMKLNGEGIYATRPWKVFGEGTHLAPIQQNGFTKLAPLDATDIRFTQSKKGDVVYAFVMGWPDGRPESLKAWGPARPPLPER